MESKEKRALSEMDICDLFITPAIKDADWDPTKQIRREDTLPADFVRALKRAPPAWDRLRGLSYSHQRQRAKP